MNSEMLPIEEGRQNPSPGVHLQSGQSNIVFLTVTTEHREPWLANAEAHRLLSQDAWLAEHEAARLARILSLAEEN